MEENKDNITSLVPISFNSLVHAGNSIAITNKLILEQLSSNSEWWESLSYEWKGILYVNLIYQSKVNTEDYPFDGLLFAKPLKFYKEKFGVDFSPDKVTDEEVYKITQLQAINCSNSEKIREFNPLRKLTSLKKLTIARTGINDISSVVPFTALEELNFGGTSVSSLAPLRCLKRLKSISCWGTKVTSLESLSEITTLNSVDCSMTPIKHLEPLKNLFNLKEVSSHSMGITELSPLSELTNLNRLVISNTRVSDITPLAPLKKSLKYLLMDGLNVSDFSPIKDFDFKWLFIGGAKITDFSFLESYKNLERLGLNGTAINTLDNIKDLHSLKELRIQSTKINDLKPLLSLPNLESIECTGMHVSDEQIMELRRLKPNCRIYR